MPCGAVPFALRCGALPCCSVLSFEHTVPGTMRKVFEKYQVPGAGMSVYYAFFCFDLLIVLARSRYFFSWKITTITPVLPIRTWHRQQAYTTAQASQLCTIALGIVKSLVARNHGPPVSAPLHIICSSPFMRLAEHLTALRALCKECLPGW